MKKTISLTLFIMLLVTAACKKQQNSYIRPSAEDSHNFTGCRIKQIVQTRPSGSATYTYFYKEDGRVSLIRISATGTQEYTDQFFNYSGNSITTSTLSSKETTMRDKDSLMLDGNGRVTAIYYEFRKNYDEFIYDSSGTSLTCIYHHNGEITSSIYKYGGGDLSWSTFQTNYYEYHYDTVLYKTGNNTATIDNMIRFGRQVIPPSVHLCSYKVLIPYADTISFTHTTDANGNLLSEHNIEHPNFSYTNTITYECK